ncbi:MAG: hypothetical protein AAF913_02600, partial [Pseudomonadota bacterium]
WMCRRARELCCGGGPRAAMFSAWTAREAQASEAATALRRHAPSIVRRIERTLDRKLADTSDEANIAQVGRDKLILAATAK